MNQQFETVNANNEVHVEICNKTVRTKLGKMTTQHASDLAAKETVIDDFSSKLRDLEQELKSQKWLLEEMVTEADEQAGEMARKEKDINDVRGLYDSTTMNWSHSVAELEDAKREIQCLR